MPYTTNVAGTVITAAWANANVRDQTISPFASTGARDSTITAPVAGMVHYLTTNDVNEGVTTRTSASTWRPGFWNNPWGVVPATSGGTGGMAIVTTTTASGTVSTTETTVSTSPTFTAVGNRIYRVTCMGTTLGTVASDLFNTRIRSTSAAGTSQFDQKLVVTGASFQTPFSIVCYVTGLTAGAQLFVLTFLRQAGTGTLQTLSGAALQWIIEDAGPSGAPA